MTCSIHHLGKYIGAYVHLHITDSTLTHIDAMNDVYYRSLS